MWILYFTMWMGTQPVTAERLAEFKTQKACEVEATKMQTAANTRRSQGVKFTHVYLCEQEQAQGQE